MQKLRCVPIATVRGARGSCVLLLIGLTTPSCTDVTGRQHHFHPPGWPSAPMKTLDDSLAAAADTSQRCSRLRMANPHRRPRDLEVRVRLYLPARLPQRPGKVVPQRSWAIP
jgi:hypothetical protein